MLQNSGLTRRGLLMLGSAAGLQSRLRLYAASSDFWNKKEPAEWSSDEIDRLVTKSPWARQVVAGAPMNRQYGGGNPAGGMGDPGIGGTSGGSPGGGGMGTPGAGGMGYPGGTAGGRRRGGLGGDDMPTFTAIVRWQSAKPVQEALKTPLPDSLAGDYVISVSGVPVLTRGRQRPGDEDADNTVSRGLSDEVLERIKELTYLEPKGKSPAQPSAVQKGAISSSGFPTLLFGFPRDVLSLSADDREVSFSTKLGAIEVKARFNLKEMMYRHELAL